MKKDKFTPLLTIFYGVGAIVFAFWGLVYKIQERKLSVILAIAAVAMINVGWLMIRLSIKELRRA